MTYLVASSASWKHGVSKVTSAINFIVLEEVNQIGQQFTAFATHEARRMPAKLKKKKLNTFYKKIKIPYLWSSSFSENGNFSSVHGFLTAIACLKNRNLCRLCIVANPLILGNLMIKSALPKVPSAFPLPLSKK